MEIKEDLPTDAVEITDQGVWSVSSNKPDFDLSKLKDGNIATYWQSSGPQPHFINISYPRKTAISKICLYLDYKVDESYTPSKIKIRYGTHLNDLEDFGLYEFSEPSGWLIIPLFNKTPGILATNSPNPQLKLGSNNFLKVFLLQIAILANHLNGRDTHVRLIKVFSPLLENNPKIYTLPFTTNSNVYSCFTNNNAILDILYKNNSNCKLLDKYTILR